MAATTGTMLEALHDPAALLSLDGRVLMANFHFRQLVLRRSDLDGEKPKLTDLLVGDSVLSIPSVLARLEQETNYAQTNIVFARAPESLASVEFHRLRSGQDCTAGHPQIFALFQLYATERPHFGTLTVSPEGDILSVDATLEMNVGHCQGDLIGHHVSALVQKTGFACNPLSTIESFCDVTLRAQPLVVVLRSRAELPVEVEVEFLPQADSCVLTFTRKTTTTGSATLDVMPEPTSTWVHQALYDLPMMLAAFGSGRSIVSWNREAERISGYSADEVMSMPDPVAVLFPGHSELVEARMADLGSASNVMTLQCKDGTTRQIRWQQSKRPMISGVTSTWLGLDVTALMQQNERLQRIAKEAEDALSAKSDFLATMSHEIRTPLNGVIGMTGLLLDTPLNFEQRELTNTARLCGTQLLELINEILDFSKIEAGRMVFEETNFCLVTIADDICELTADRAQTNGLHLAFAMDPTVPGVFVGDGTRVRQVVLNLVSNAIKFTQRGGVTVRLRDLGDEPSAPDGFRVVRMRVEVTDTGIGMTEEQVSRIFQPFTQADQSTTRKYGGTGLGLVISKRIVELMGGRIGVESKPDVGSTFFFELPLKTPLGPGCGHDAAQTVAKRRPTALSAAAQSGRSPTLSPLPPAATVSDDCLLSPVARSPADCPSPTSCESAPAAATACGSESPLQPAQADPSPAAGDAAAPAPAPLVPDLSTPDTLKASSFLLVHPFAPASEGVRSRLFKLQMPDVDIATTAAEALAMARTKPYRIVFVARVLDGQEDGGLALSLELRRLRPRTGYPLVVLTRPLKIIDSDEKLAAHGVAAVLPEPVRSCSFFAVIKELDASDMARTAALAQADGAAFPGDDDLLAGDAVGTWPHPVVHADQRRAAQPTQTSVGLRVLLAEDNMVNQRLATLVLQKLGHHVDAVSNGQEALEQLSRLPYDLVLMDCQMPEMDGFEATRLLRTWDGPVARTPVVALTANAMQGDRERCQKAGMDDYLAKPFEVEQLRAVIDRVLNKRHRVDMPMPPLADPTPPTSPSAVPPPTPQTTSAPPPSTQPPSASLPLSPVIADPEGSQPGMAPATQPVLDEMTVSTFRALDEDGSAWRSLVSMFVAQQPQRVLTLRDHFIQAQASLTALSQAAHSLKGGASGIGALRLATAADVVEKAARLRTLPRTTDVEVIERESVLASQALQRTV